jgi:hypothetical protein
LLLTTVGLTAADRQETGAAFGPVVVEWRWGVCDGGLLEESNDAATFQLTVDGRVVGGGSMVQYRTQDRLFDEFGIEVVSKRVAPQHRCRRINLWSIEACGPADRSWVQDPVPAWLRYSGGSLSSDQ